MLGDDVARADVAHVEAEVAAEHDAIRADRRDEIAEGVRRVADRVVGEAPEVALEGLPGAVARLGPHALAVAKPPDEVRERAARVRQAHLELRVAVEDAAKTRCAAAIAVSNGFPRRFPR